MSKANLGSIYQRTKKLPDGTVRTLPTWWIKYRKNGQVFRESSWSEKADDAKRLLKRRVGEVATGKFAGLGPERVRFFDLTEAVLNDYRDNERSSLDHVTRRLRLHILPALGGIRAADLGTAHIKQYVTNRREQKASNASINRELSIVKRAFRLALDSDPPRVTRAPKISMLAENNVRVGFLEYEQYIRLREELPEPIRPIFVVAYYVGCRKGELMMMRWDQIDLVANRLTLWTGTTKSRKGRSAPLYGELRQWLLIEKEIRDTRFPGCPYVFRRGGKPVKNFRKSWDAACERAGLAGLMFHDLRRSAIRNMTRAGIPEKIAMQISGHKTRSVFDRYDIVSDRDLDLAAERMQLHMENLDKQTSVCAPLGTLLGTPTTFGVKTKDNEKRASRLQ